MDVVVEFGEETTYKKACREMVSDNKIYLVMAITDDGEIVVSHGFLPEGVLEAMTEALGEYARSED